MESSTWVPMVFKSSVETAPLMAATVPTFIKTGVCDRAVNCLHLSPFGTSVLCQNLTIPFFSFLRLISYHIAPVRQTEE